MKYSKLAPLILLISLTGCGIDNLDSPVPVSPNGWDYEIHNESILFEWQYPDSALAFFLEVARDYRFKEIIFSDSTIKDTTFLIPIDSFAWDSTYYWRISALKENSWSDWSDTSFTFKTFPLCIPIPISPIGSEYHRYNKGILFSWKSAGGPFKYNLEVAKDENFGELLFSDSTIEGLSQIVLVDSFQLDKTYYWRVRESNWIDWGEWSEPVNFTYKLDFDLDTTYFPFYLGREWRYECHHYGYDSLDEWNYYDTLTIKVTDSIWKSSVLNASLDTAFILLPNPAKITATGWIGIGGFISTTAPLTPFEVSTHHEEYGEYSTIYKSLNISYIWDTLSISTSYTEGEYFAVDTDSLYSKFVKGTGVVSQRSCHLEIRNDSTVNCDYVDYDLIPSSILVWPPPGLSQAYFICSSR